MSMNLTCVMNIYHGDNPKYFREAFESIINQTYKADKILLVVDGPLSKDLDLTISKYSHIESLEIHRLKKNLGLNGARKYALEQCDTELVALMDSDDICALNRFEKQIDIFKSANIDYVGGQIEEFYENSKIKYKRIVPEKHDDIIRFAKYRAPINNVTSMFKKEAYLRSGGYRLERGYEDYKLFFRFLNSGAKFYNIKDILVYVRSNEDRISRHKGFDHFKTESKFFWNLYKNGSINIMEFFINLLLRLPARFLPNLMVRQIYKIINSNFFK